MNDIAKVFIVMAFVAIVGALIFAMWLIGNDRLFTLALILVGGVAVAAIVAASALPIRAAKKRDLTGETRIIDGTKTIVRETRVIDGRQALAPEVKLLQLPQQPQGGAWPELLRASWQAGLLANPRGQSKPAEASGQNGQDLAELDLGEDDWGGDIAP